MLRRFVRSESVLRVMDVLNCLLDARRTLHKQRDLSTMRLDGTLHKQYGQVKDPFFRRTQIRCLEILQVKLVKVSWSSIKGSGVAPCQRKTPLKH